MAPILSAIDRLRHDNLSYLPFNPPLQQLAPLAPRRRRLLIVNPHQPGRRQLRVLRRRMKEYKLSNRSRREEEQKWAEKQGENGEVNGIWTCPVFRFWAFRS